LAKKCRFCSKYNVGTSFGKKSPKIAEKIITHSIDPRLNLDDVKPNVPMSNGHAPPSSSPKKALWAFTGSSPKGKHLSVPRVVPGTRGINGAGAYVC
jgi:hypothetical protein